ncbi:MAG: signal recognition particle-docking protein FtsY [uncultured bacterium]|nr:MAG: signal recognition particle-docking protein FtsY [uncultured bacterium]
MFDIFKKFKDQGENKQNINNSEVEEQTNEEGIQPQSDPIENNNVKKNLFGISFSNLKQAISRTSESLVDNVLVLTQGKQEIDDDLLDEMEEALIKADLGVDTSVDIIEKLRDNKSRIRPERIGEFLKNEFNQVLGSTKSNSLNVKDNQLNIFLVTGVNGVGKTTLIGKLAYRFKMQGKKVIVAAGDTYRAAAEDQLEIWTNRAGAEIIRRDGADPASVVYDAIIYSKEQKADILLIDTAGRLQNKFNLMEELSKVKRVIDREAPECLSESLLVLDATTGQNGLKQAEVFNEAVQLTSVALTKLDGTAKGGVVIAVSKEFGLPVKLIGVGEKLEDLKDFNPDDFVNALFEK